MNETTITAFFEQDHDRLDGLFKKFQSLKRTDFPKAKEAFKDFNLGLKRHIIWEEEILFPVFEQKTGMGEVGPTAVMRMEHRLIHQSLDEIHEKVRQQNPDSDGAEAQLLQTLSLHNQKEENVLYPAIDQMVNDLEREDIFKKLQKLPAEQLGTCCA